jgi:DTW domain-containing protein YfiP
MAEKLQKKLANFQVEHHETLLNYYKEKMEWWRVQTDVDKSRCRVCWLRSHQCYCKTLAQKKAVYDAWLPKPNIKVCMYYNAVEIARSANTAHVLEATCPDIVYPIILGDLEKEKQLMDDIERENKENAPQTCIMFPSKEAKLLSDWMAARPAAVADRPIRLVMLDGTYPGATRIAKYMINCCTARGISAPLVKLDLVGDSCKSAVAGMMYQPGKDKICTYQATVMAMQQAGVDPKLCECLHRDLQDWIGYILTAKVKLGKTQPRNSMRNVMDVTPDDFIAQTLVSNPSAVCACDSTYHENVQLLRAYMCCCVIHTVHVYAPFIFVGTNTIKTQPQPRQASRSQQQRAQERHPADQTRRLHRTKHW